MKFPKSLVLALGFASQLAVAAPPPTLMCPSVYQPARCTYEDFAAEGSNRCFALISLKQILAQNAVSVKPELIRCQSTDVAFASADEDLSEESENLTTDGDPAR